MDLPVSESFEYTNLKITVVHHEGTELGFSPLRPALQQDVTSAFLPQG